MPRSHYEPRIDDNSLRLIAMGISQVVQLFVIAIFILLLVWLFDFRGSFHFDAHDPEHVFNVHPFLMVFGFILPNGEAIMAYKLLSGNRPLKRKIHMICNLVAFCLGIVGIGAAIKYHNMVNLGHSDSFHSWIGICTMGLFVVQWLFGFYAFMLGKKSTTEKETSIPCHVLLGKTVFYMGITAVLTGLTEKASLMGLKHQPESYVINVTGLTVLVFGFCVPLAVTLGRSSY